MKAFSVIFLLSIFLNFSEGSQKRTFELNTTISPCEDFYEHVCSKVVQSYNLREDRSRHVFSFNDASDNLLGSKKGYLAHLKAPSNSRQRNLKSIYSACTNEKERKSFEKNYIAATLKFIKTVPNSEKLYDFFSAQAVRGEEFAPISFGPIANLDNPLKNDVYFLSDWLSLPERTYYEKEETVHDLIALVKDFFDTLKEPNSQQRAESVVQFQIDVSKTVLLPVELRDRTSMKTSITREEIDKKWPNLRLKTLLDKLPKSVVIRNLSPENFNWLQDTGAKVPLEVLKDAYLFRLLPDFMDVAYPTYYQKAFEFRRKHLGGPNDRPKRKEECTLFVMDRYGMEFDHELLPTLFPGFPEERIREIAQKVRDSILMGIERAQWLSPNAKKSASEKIKRAELQLVKPKTDKDWNFLPNGNYSDKIHYENVRTLNKVRTLDKYSKLNGDRNLSEWEMSPLEVNAYYDPSNNKFVLPLGILQSPFFEKTGTNEELLGSIGAVIGHELGHAIDDKGSKFNAQGQLVRWMGDSDLEAFNQQVSKLKKQLEDNGLAAHLQIGEFIGDLTGISFAYEAAFPKESPPQKKRDFFLRYARVWCEAIRPQYAELLAKTDPHPPGKFRVNGVLMHLKGFQEAFACKEGSKMSLPDKERVRVW